MVLMLSSQLLIFPLNSYGFTNPESSLYDSNTRISIIGDLTNEEINLGYETFSSSINNEIVYQIIDYDEIHTLDGILVIFGHGDQVGISLFSDIYLSWGDFVDIFRDTLFDKVIIVSCYGSMINEYSKDKDFFITWTGNQDSVILGNAAAYQILNLVGSLSNKLFELIFKGALTRMYNIFFNNVDPMYLAYSESGYAAAYKRENTGNWATASRILWVNMDKDKGDTWATSTVGIEHLILTLRNVAVLGAAVATVLAVAFLANMVFMALSSYNRYRHDYKFGVQGYKLVPSLNFVYHLGNDNYRLNGIFYIPIIGVSGYILYFGIGGVSTSWRSMNL